MTARRVGRTLTALISATVLALTGVTWAVVDQPIVQGEHP